MFWTAEKLRERLAELSEYRYRDSIAIESFECRIDEEGEIGAYPPDGGEWSRMSVGDSWQGYDTYMWLKADVAVPADWKGRKIVGLFHLGGTDINNISGFESLLFVNGKPYQGVDTNHTEVILPEETCGSAVSLCFRLWSGMDDHEPLMRNFWETLGPVRHRFHAAPEFAGRPNPRRHALRQARICWLDETADDLYYLGRAALETALSLGGDSPDRSVLLTALDRSLLLLDWSKPGSDAFHSSAAAARRRLRTELEALGKRSDISVRCIGHTHIDLAWLWRLKHSREKAARSFSTVLRMMEQFPEYVFLQTQPQMYDDMKRDYPELYGQLKRRIGEGRWEASGGMWLEADCNMTSGESLVRQLLHGTRFLREEFGVECTYLWLPDVFGYSWALPQILRKSGIGAFMTTKINMLNQYNEMPHHTFRWKGMDGTEVLTHFAGHTYSGLMNAESIADLWSRYKDKDWNRQLLYVYGYGDGGGGVNREMLEMRRRLAMMPGMPQLETGRVDDYFEELERTACETDHYVHTWQGELYFEYHRGTYTSQAFVKKMNRKCELALRETEWLNVLKCLQTADWSAYSGAALREAWTIVLRNQFHDIIPGSSVREVYEDCRAEYGEAVRLIDAARASAVDALTDGEDARSVVVFNNASQARTDLLRIAALQGFDDGVWVGENGQPLPSQRGGEDWLVLVAGLPPMGYSAIRFVPGAAGGTEQPSDSPFRKTDNGIVTPYYEIEWNGRGQLVRLFDREAGRSVLADGARGNVLQVFEDKPLMHDAWDIEIYYREKMREIELLTAVSLREAGPLRAVVRFEWSFGDSRIVQDMMLYANDRRIDFDTAIDWHERQQLLKAAFPVSVHATEATYDIQFGNVKRPTHWNTSWDYARFEVVGHQWADLSERGYGVGLLNDCKYGYDIHDGVMRLTLLKSAIYPDYAADQGEHRFTYSLLPHRGDWYEGGTAEAAWSLNNPLSYAVGKQALPSLSLFRLSAAHVAIDAVKKAEDGNAVILRVHEYAGARGEAEVTGDFDILSWQECDLMESPTGVRSFAAAIRFRIAPYEIKTFRVEMGGVSRGRLQE